MPKKDQILFFRANWDSRNFWGLVNFGGIFQLEVALKDFLWMIWWCPRYLKGCPATWLSSAHQIVTLRIVKVKLSFRKRTKDQILLFRANWDFRNFWVLVHFFKRFFNKLFNSLDRFCIIFALMIYILICKTLERQRGLKF